MHLVALTVNSASSLSELVRGSSGGGSKEAKLAVSHMHKMLCMPEWGGQGSGRSLAWLIFQSRVATCDVCSQIVHLHCASPPMKSTPHGIHICIDFHNVSGHWICKACIEGSVAAAASEDDAPRRRGRKNQAKERCPSRYGFHQTDRVSGDSGSEAATTHRRGRKKRQLCIGDRYAAPLQSRCRPVAAPLPP